MTTHSNHSNRVQNLATRQQELLSSLDRVLNVLSPWKLVDTRSAPDSMGSILMSREAACDSRNSVSVTWQKLGAPIEVRLSAVRRNARGGTAPSSVNMTFLHEVPNVSTLMEWLDTYLRWNGFTLIEDESEGAEEGNIETKTDEVPVVAPTESASAPKAQPKLKSKSIPAQRKKGGKSKEDKAPTQRFKSGPPQPGTLAHAVLQYVKNNPGCTRSDVGKDFEHMSYKATTAGAALTDLRERGYVKAELRKVRIGTPTGGRVIPLQFFTATDKE